ncbi:MAG: hypothetical protein Q4G37_01965 [Bifidobacterium sp.]|nr:hypothetical protein [Bifidobacterium sp.]
MFTRLPECALQLRRGRVSLIAWPVAMSAILSLYCTVFGAMLDDIKAQQQTIHEMPEAMQKLFSDNMMSDGASFVYTVFFSLIGFILLSIASVTWGQSVVAGPSDSGELELSASRGIARASFLGQRIAAIVLRMVIVGVAISLVLAGFNGHSQLGLTAGGEAVAIVGWLGHGALVGAVTNLVGVATLKRSAAIAAGTSVAVWSYLAQAVGKLLDSLQWMCWLSPQYWIFRDNPLADITATTLWGIVAVWALAVGATAASFVLFRRRDLV